MPSHVGKVGNKTADKLVKEGIEKIPPEKQIKNQNNCAEYYKKKQLMKLRLLWPASDVTITL